MGSPDERDEQGQAQIPDMVDDEISEVNADCAIYIPPGATQYIENVGAGDLVFLCIVDPAWRPQDEEVLEDDS